MFISKKEFEAMKKKQEQQDQAIDNLYMLLMQQEQEIKELKNPKTSYMG